MKHSIKAHSPQAARFFLTKTMIKAITRPAGITTQTGTVTACSPPHKSSDVFRVYSTPSCGLKGLRSSFTATVISSSFVTDTLFSCKRAPCDNFLPRKVILFFLTTLYQKANGVSPDFNSRLPSQASSAVFSVLPWSPRCNPRPLLPARRVPQSRSTRRCPARRNFSRRSYQSFGRRP